MFNKPGVFGRNEPITRRDVQPVVSGASPASTPPAADKNVSILRNGVNSGVNSGANNSHVSNSSTTATAASGSSASGSPSASSETESASAQKPAASQASSSVMSTDATAVGKEAWSSASKPVTGADQGSDARLIVGPDVKLKGAEILDCDTLVVEGRVEATMDSRVIRIAENGSFSGKVSIDIAEIHGTFEGELTARSQLIIHSTGRVSGKIRFGTLVVDEGGELCGEINVLSEKDVSNSRSVVEPFVALGAASG